MIKKQWKLITLILIPTLISACASNKYVSSDPMNNVKSWNEATRAQHIFPVFPPRGIDNLPIGAVFMQNETLYDEMVEWKEKKNYLPMRNVTTLLPISDQSIIKSSDSPLPKYDYVVQNANSLSTTLPINGIPFGSLFSSNSKAHVSIEFLNTKQSSLTDSQIKNIFENWKSTPAGQQELTNFYNENPYYPQLKNSTNKRIIRIITSLFTAQKMNITIDYGSNKLGDIQLGAAAPLVMFSDEKQDTYSSMITSIDNKIQILNQSSNSTTTSKNQEGNESNLIVTNNEKVQELKTLVELKSEILKYERQEMLDKYSRIALPGGEGAFITHKGNTITINQTFSNPIVVGYWAIEYQLDKNSENQLRTTYINENYYKLLNDKNYQKLINKTVDIVTSQKPKNS